MLDHKTPELVAELRELSSRRTVVLLDYTTNGDVTDLTTPLSHAALVAQRIQERWQSAGRRRERRTAATSGERTIAEE